MTYLRVKVCGITRERDARLAADLGAAMIGMVFVRRSPRFVSLDTARRLVTTIPPTVQKVGVFVDQSVDLMLRRAEQLGLDWLQLHGQETDHDINKCHQQGMKVIRAFAVEADFDWQRVMDSPADMVLLDNARGGSGRTFNWRNTPPGRMDNLILAGGINTKNLSRGVKLFSPKVVDVNSSVESCPGVKSPVRLRRFMSACHQLNRSVFTIGRRP